uniref:NADH dehydrogenase subunit 6 n=1 Tax=Euplotes vannus TaxID=5939 RepID=UPI002E78210E|nr:NADH dehydrogenase subunit 6 [Euplotes vannus]UPM52094.1 NADH dehydrogenase subunit 6 [Euplotes vannus]
MSIACTFYYGFSVSVFNDFILLQFFFILLLVFFLFLWDSFFLIINAVCFLSIVALFAWLIDSDIYINFLVIIDLGVFFILLGFLLNFISLFRETRGSSNPLLSFLVFGLLVGAFSCFSDAEVGTAELPLLVTYYDWFSIFNFYYFTDLQLLSDIYYVLAGLEFLLMNFYLYSVILVIYCLRRSPQERSDFFLTTFKDNVTVRGNFMRTQDIQSQILSRATVRVWQKKN